MIFTIIRAFVHSCIRAFVHSCIVVIILNKNIFQSFFRKTNFRGLPALFGAGAATQALGAALAKGAAQALGALGAILLLCSCGDLEESPTPSLIPVISHNLIFRNSEVFQSKMLYRTQGKASYTNQFVQSTRNVAYEIIQPASYTGEISLDAKTGTLTFQDTPETIVVQAKNAHGGTATYRFTITDHFSERSGHSSVLVGSEIYVIGGGNAGAGNLDDVWKSADGGKIWEEVPATGIKFSDYRDYNVALLGSEIYVIGRIRRRDPITRRFDHFHEVRKSADGGKTWTTVATGQKFYDPKPYVAYSVVTLGTEIYLIGGNDGGVDFNDVWKSADSGKTWTKVPLTGTGFPVRSNHSSVVVGSEIYVIDGDSGIGGRNKRDDIWKSADGGQSWTEVPATGAEFLDYDSQNLAVLDSEIYVIGVVDGTRYLDDVWKSADGGQTWTEVPVTGAKFSARSGHSLVVVGSEIYLIGGFDGTNYLNDVWKSADRGLTWKNVHAAP